MHKMATRRFFLENSLEGSFALLCIYPKPVETGSHPPSLYLALTEVCLNRNSSSLMSIRVGETFPLFEVECAGGGPKLLGTVIKEGFGYIVHAVGETRLSSALFDHNLGVYRSVDNQTKYGSMLNCSLCLPASTNHWMSLLSYTSISLVSVTVSDRTFEVRRHSQGWKSLKLLGW